MEYCFIVKDNNKSTQLDAARAIEAFKETSSDIDKYQVNRSQ